MEETYARPYQLMQQELQCCLQMNLPEQERVQHAYWAASNHCARLVATVKQKGFDSAADEIRFFRHVKPYFTSYIEYFVLISEAIVCEPRTTLLVEQYWKEELIRCTRLFARHTEFISYIDTGARHTDDFYFLRAGLPHRRAFTIFDIDNCFSTSHDGLLRKLLAYRLFESYCLQKLRKTGS